MEDVKTKSPLLCSQRSWFTSDLSGVVPVDSLVFQLDIQIWSHLSLLDSQCLAKGLVQSHHLLVFVGLSKAELYLQGFQCYPVVSTVLKGMPASHISCKSRGPGSWEGELMPYRESDV